MFVHAVFELGMCDQVVFLSLSNQLFCLLQLDQLVVDAAKEKRDMEQKHSTIQQKVHSHSVSRFPSSLRFKHKYAKHKNNIPFLVLDT